MRRAGPTASFTAASSAASPSAVACRKAAGGRVTTVEGADSRDEDLEKIVTNGLIHDELLEAIRSA